MVSLDYVTLLTGVVLCWSMVLSVSDYSGTGLTWRSICLWFLPTETCELSYAFLRGHMLGKIIGISREPVAKGHLLGHWRFFGERNDMEVVRSGP